MAGWRPIHTALRETNRPLLLYPHPYPRGITQDQPPSDEPLLDLTNFDVRRMIKLARKRGYVTYEELNRVLPSEKFTAGQIKDVLGQLSALRINVVRAKDVSEPDAGENQPAATPDHQWIEDRRFTAAVTYGGVFEGYWDGSRWRTAGGVPCEPTHWMPMPASPLTLVGQ